jgi:two-component system, NtrC family, response regulator
MTRRTEPALDGLIAASAPMVDVCRTIERIGPTDTTVLIQGERGTGKERLARAVHALSRRASKPMLALHCAALYQHRLESALFGHERRGFSGAPTREPGLLERAEGSTLFLDDIGHVPVGVQTKLLRALDARAIERLDDLEPIPLNVRIIAATTESPEAAIARGQLRPDLHGRLTQVAISLPALRDRPGDSVLIANHILHAARPHARALSHFAPDAISAIETYRWPGNVRELESRVTRAVLSGKALITAQDLGLPPRDAVDIRSTRAP